MTDQTQWAKALFELTRSSFEVGMRSMDVFPKQVEKAINLAMENAGIVQEETKKAFKAWLENVEKARSVYAKTIDEGLGTLEQQFSTKDKPKSK
jgi:hypothetical protein